MECEISFGPDILYLFISTHTPCVGRDTPLLLRHLHNIISTHTPCVGRDVSPQSSFVSLSTFQLTRPVWGVTKFFMRSLCFLEFQLTRPAWGVTTECRFSWVSFTISTHTPCVGRDINCHFLNLLWDHFNSHALRGA